MFANQLDDQGNPIDPQQQGDQGQSLDDILASLGIGGTSDGSGFQSSEGPRERDRGVPTVAPTTHDVFGGGEATPSPGFGGGGGGSSFTPPLSQTSPQPIAASPAPPAMQSGAPPMSDPGGPGTGATPDAGSFFGGSLPLQLDQMLSADPAQSGASPAVARQPLMDEANANPPALMSERQAGLMGGAGGLLNGGLGVPTPQGGRGESRISRTLRKFVG